MKSACYSLIAAAALAAFSLSPTSAADKPADAAVEKAIKQLETDWANALVKADMATINRIVAPDWVLCDPTGRMQTKKEADADLTSGKLKFESFRNDDLQVRVYGDTAIAFGLETEKSTYQGKDSSGQYRFTDVFVNRDGRWQAVATHVTKVAKE